MTRLAEQLALMADVNASKATATLMATRAAARWRRTLPVELSSMRPRPTGQCS